MTQHRSRMKLLIILLALITTFTLSYALTNAELMRQSQIVTTSAPTMTISHTIREGYKVIEEATLLEWSRSSLEVTDITEEKIFYVQAGYWRYTSTNPNYRTDPNHPIFLYTVRGKITGSMFDLGAPSSNPDAPTPEYKPEEAATVAVDAVSGYLLYWTNTFTADPSPDILTYDRNLYLTELATLEARLEPYGTLPALYPTFSASVTDTVPLPLAP